MQTIPEFNFLAARPIGKKVTCAEDTFHCKSELPCDIPFAMELELIFKNSRSKRHLTE